MNNVIDITPHLEAKHANQPHCSIEAICLACYNRFMLVHAAKTWLKEIICDCGVKGMIINTGQFLYDEEGEE